MKTGKLFLIVLFWVPQLYATADETDERNVHCLISHIYSGYKQVVVVYKDGSGSIYKKGENSSGKKCSKEDLQKVIYDNFGTESSDSDLSDDEL